MANITDPRTPKPQAQKAKGTVTVRSVGPVPQTDIRKAPARMTRQDLSRASAIYGAAASVFGVLTIFMMIKGMWITSLIMIVPTFCLAGFAWYYMKA